MSTFVYAYTRFIALKQPIKALTEKKMKHIITVEPMDFLPGNLKLMYFTGFN